MNTRQRARAPRHPAPWRQRGVLFIALIGMVVLSLAAVALLRSIDSGTSISGNLAFKQATVGPVNYAVEQATYALFEGPPAARIADPFNNDAAHHYYANLQAGESASGVPVVIYGPAPAYPFVTYTDPTTQYNVKWVIERMCQGTNAPPPYFGDPIVSAGLIACDLMVPKVSQGRTTMKLTTPPVPPIPLYRVTIRIEGPTNTVTYAQAMLRG